MLKCTAQGGVGSPGSAQERCGCGPWGHGVLLVGWCLNLIISEIFSDFNDSMVGQEQPKVWHLEATEPGLSRGALAMEGTGEDKKSSFFLKLGSDMWVDME